MTTGIEVRDLPWQSLLVQKTTCGHQGIGPAFAAALHSVRECLRASGAKMASMSMAVYLNWREADCDMAVGCMVHGNVTLTQGCEWLDVPGGPHACASHIGPYTALHETHAAIQGWCAANNRKISGPCWEAYPTDPESQPDSSKWQTDVRYPIKAS